VLVTSIVIVCYVLQVQQGLQQQAQGAGAHLLFHVMLLHTTVIACFVTQVHQGLHKQQAQGAGAGQGRPLPGCLRGVVEGATLCGQRVTQAKKAGGCWLVMLIRDQPLFPGSLRRVVEGAALRGQRISSLWTIHDCLSYEAAAVCNSVGRRPAAQRCVLWVGVHRSVAASGRAYACMASV
jgi:hypothetical protein